MATSEVGFSSNSGNSSTGNIAFVSGIAANDKIVVVVAKNVTADTVVTPSGFSVLSTKLVVGSTLQVNWFVKNAAGTETGNLALDFGGNGKWSAGMGVIRGSDTPVVSATTAGDNTNSNANVAFPGFTPTAANAYAMAIGGVQAPATPMSLTPPATWTEKVDLFSAATDPNVGVYIAGKQLSGGPSAQSSVNATSSGNTRDAIYIVTFPPSATNAAPTANAGPDQVDKEFRDVVTLNGTGSSDSDGTIASYAWTPPGGITLSSNSVASPTFTVPAVFTNTNYTFSLIVTDNNGASSSADTVVISVLAHPDWMRVGGSWTPMYPPD